MKFQLQRSLLLLFPVLAGSSYAQGAGEHVVSYRWETDEWEYCGFGDVIELGNPGSTHSLAVGYSDESMTEALVVVELPPFSTRQVPVRCPQNPSKVVTSVGLQGEDEADALCMFDCLPPGTLLPTNEGLRPVEELVSMVGVLASPAENCVPVPCPELRITQRWTRETVTLTAGGEQLTLTGGHRVALEGGRWLRADQVRVGSRILAGAGAQPVTVTGTESTQHATPTPVYHLELPEAGVVRVGTAGFHIEVPGREGAAHARPRLRPELLPKSGPVEGRSRILLDQLLRKARRAPTPFCSSLVATR